MKFTGKTILIVDDEESIRDLLDTLLTKEGYHVLTAVNGEEAVRLIAAHRPHLVIMDIRMPMLDGMQAFRHIHDLDKELPVILMTAFGTVDTAVEAMRLGAYDYLTKPFNIDEMKVVVRKALQYQALADEVHTLRTELTSQYNLGDLIGSSGCMQEIYKLIGRVAELDTTVLIHGESGTGKEMIARTIHYNSLRKQGPFIRVNCAALPEGLLESELFGYERGAFTGAHQAKPGRFELAHGGTIFLDEIGDMSPALQAKLLHVLQEKEFERVGGINTIKVNVRIIAATNRDLSAKIREQSFREDLYYRLNVVSIYVPPLRERKEDIPLLVEHFIRKASSKLGRDVRYISRQAMDMLLRYNWPGNVRELENAVERAAVVCSGHTITTDHLPITITAVTRNETGVGFPQRKTLKNILKTVEKQVIAETLRETKGNKYQAARILGLSRRALQYKIAEYGLEGMGKHDGLQVVEKR